MFCVNLEESKNNQTNNKKYLLLVKCICLHFVGINKKKYITSIICINILF